MLDALLKQLDIELNSHDWSGVLHAAANAKKTSLERIQSRLAQRRGGDATSDRLSASGQSYLVTGAAGFIGSHLTRRLLAEGHRVTGIDDFNDYYDPVMKWGNIEDLLDSSQFALHQADIRDADRLRSVVIADRFDVIIHLAARAGVRPSIVDPGLYVTSNVLGTQNVLDMARAYRIPNFVYASSSSVYGGNMLFPFSEAHNVDRPISPYAATKKANELQAACYAQLYGIATSGLRFFTVYGPGGRPDMAVRSFIEKMDRGEPVPLYGDGSFERDYTYIDDIVDGILGVSRAAEGKLGWCEVFNLGESDTTSVLELILLIAIELGKLGHSGDIKGLSQLEQQHLIEQLKQTGCISELPEQLGDVPKTYADVSKARQMAAYRPQVGIVEGIRRTVRWHQQRKQRVEQVTRRRLFDALRVQCNLRTRAGLDSAGRHRNANFELSDARALLEALGDVASVAREHDHEFLALRVQVELADMLCAVAQYLSAPNHSSRHRSSDSR